MFARIALSTPVWVAALVASGLAIAPPGQIVDAAEADAKTLIVSEMQAVASAVATGEPVEVIALRDEYSKYFANPDGQTRRAEISTVPFFGRDADNQLVPIDTTLVRDADGRLAPVASAARSSLPNGDDSTVTVGFRGRALSMSMPGRLRSPRVDGSTATYPDVFPGIDLKLTATAEGLKQVYVVKTRGAAKNPALDVLVMPAKTEHATLRSNAMGGLAVVDTQGEIVFSAPPPVMWDSRGDESERLLPRGYKGRYPDGSSPHPAFLSPGIGDEVREMPMTVARSSIRVRPVRGMLDDPKAVYPIFIDPTLGIDRGERMMLRSDGVESWQFAGDEGMGKCPISYFPTLCTGPYAKRLYYEFPRPASLNAGDLVYGAEFAVMETHSANCEPRRVDLKQTSVITADSVWPGPDPVAHMGNMNVAYGHGANCPDRQLEFRTDALEAASQRLANGEITRLAMRLSAYNETDQIAWKRFDNLAVMRIDFVRKPGVPTGVGVLSNSAYHCGTYAAPTITASISPTFRAIVQTLVQPPAGSALGDLRARFWLQRLDVPTSTWVNAMGTADGYRYRPNASEGWDPDGTTETLVLADLGVKLLPATTYRIIANTQSIYNPGTTTHLDSGWSSWCYFKVDPDAPLPPVVTSTDGVYPEEKDGIINWTGGPRTPGSFGFAPNPSDDDPNIGRYAPTVVGQGATVVPSGTSGAVVTPDTYGPHELRVTAYDVLSRPSLPYTYRFNVAAPPPEFGIWHVTRDDGTTVSDTGTEGTRHPLTLTGPGVALSPEGTGRRGNLVDPSGLSIDRALRFSGAAGSAAATSGNVIRTELPLTFSAWVVLDDLTNDATALWHGSADGSTGFGLNYSAATKSWTFGWKSSGSWTRATAPQKAVPGVWTHLTGIYDPENHQIRLLVNGRPAGTASVTANATSSALSVGGSSSTSTLAPFRGLVDEVRAWQRVLPDQEVLDLAAEIDPLTGESFYSLMGLWSTRLMATDSLPDLSAFARQPMSRIGGATFDVPNGYVELDGQQDGLVTSGPVVDETGSFTVQTHIRVDSAGLHGKPDGFRTRLAGQRGTVANGFSSWAVWLEKRGTGPDGNPVGVVSFGRWSATGSTQSPTVATNPDVLATLDAPSQLSAVYDAPSKLLRLYLGAVLLGETPYEDPSQGSGDLSAGMGWQGTGWGEWTDGGIRGVRVWAGALTANQLNQVNGVDW